MLIGAGVSAAGSITAAKIGSNAAKSAAKTQSDAANQAMQYQSQMFNQIAPWAQQQQQASQQMFAPYQQMGNSALGALYQRLGLNPGMGAGPQPVANSPNYLGQIPQMGASGQSAFGPMMGALMGANGGQVAQPNWRQALMGAGGLPAQMTTPLPMPTMQQGPRSPVRTNQTPYMPLPGPQRPDGGG